MLLDEPFGSLDASMRASVRADVRHTLAQTGTTAILVTHDQDEAMSLADQLAVLRDGRIAQQGTPRELYFRPVDAELAQFLGSANLLDGVVDASGSSVMTSIGQLPLDRGRSPAGTKVIVLVRPEQILLAKLSADGADRRDNGRHNQVGRVIGYDFHGHDATVRLSVDAVGPHRSATLVARASGSPYFDRGSEVALERVRPGHGLGGTRVTGSRGDRRQGRGQRGLTRGGGLDRHRTRVLIRRGAWWRGTCARADASAGAHQPHVIARHPRRWPFGMAMSTARASAFADALSAGVNHLDVAPQYGRAQELLGPSIAPVRDGLFVACKTLRHSRDGVRAQLEDSLRLLQCDHFDLYQLHAVTSVAELDARAGAVEAIVQARDEGLCRWIGITGHDLTAPAAHLEALHRYDFDTVMFPVNPRLWADDTYRRAAEALLDEAGGRDVGVMAIKAAAARPWGTRPHTSATWYEPYTGRAELTGSISFSLSVPGVHCICTPGDRDLLPLVLEIVNEFEPQSAPGNAAAVSAVQHEAHIFPMPTI